MRKQTDEETIVDERLGGLQPPLVDVHDVGDFLEGVGGYSRGKKHADERKWNVVNAKSTEDAHKRVDEKIEIFENPKNRKIQNEGENKPLLAPRICATRSDFLCDQKIHRGAADHQSKEAPIPPAVEKITGEE